MTFQRMREGVMVDCTFQELIDDTKYFGVLSDSKSWLICHLADTLEKVYYNARNLEAALRGVQGIQFEDGYEINVAQLRETLVGLGDEIRRLTAERDSYEHSARHWKKDYDDLRASVKEKMLEAYEAGGSSAAGGQAGETGAEWIERTMRDIT